MEFEQDAAWLHVALRSDDCVFSAPLASRPSLHVNVGCSSGSPAALGIRVADAGVRVTDAGVRVTATATNEMAAFRCRWMPTAGVAVGLSPEPA